MAQISQSGVIVLNITQVNKKKSQKKSLRAFKSAEYALFDVALHVRSGVDHIKNIYAYNSPKMYLFLCVNINIYNQLCLNLFLNTTMESMIL